LQKKTKNKRTHELLNCSFLSTFFFHHLYSSFRFRVESQENQPAGTKKKKKRVSRRFPDLASSQVRAACEFISCRRRRHMRTITNGTRAIQSKVGNHTLFFSNSSFSLTANLLKSL
jgi:hypothetical protein